MATFNFNCPQCGNLLSGEDEWRGMETQCPTCNKKFRDNGTFDKLNEDNVAEMLEAQASTGTPTVVSGVLTEMPSIEDKKHLSSPDYKTNTCSTNNNTGNSNTNSYNIEGGSFKSKTLVVLPPLALV